MTAKLTNNATTRLAVSIGTGDTSFSVQAGDGAKFPTISGPNDWFPMTALKSDGTLEIMRCTGRSGDSFTVVRAQEGTSAKAFNSNDRIDLRFTAGTFEDRMSEKMDKAGGSFTGAITVVGDINVGAGGKIVMEGATDDAFETTIDPGDPTADRTLTLPDKSGTLAVQSDVDAKLPLAGGTMTGALKLAKGANIASVATTDLSTATGNTVHITGTTAITAVTLNSGQVMDVIFDGILTLTHHATNNNLPGAANITTAAGDRARYFYDGTTVYCLSYTPAASAPVVFSSASENAAGTVENKAVDPLGIREALNATGSAPVHASRGWVNFNGAGTVAIRASGNVSSITDNGIGAYTVNASVALADANYAAVGSCNGDGSGSNIPGTVTISGQANTGVAILVRDGGSGPVDRSIINVVLFR